MASGNVMFTFSAWQGVAPDTNYATFGVITGTSSPVELIPVAEFDDGLVDEVLDFYGILPDHYDGGGLTCTIVFAHSSAVTGPTWNLAFRRIQDDAEDLDTTAHTYDFNAVAAFAPSAVGEVSYDDITFTNGADIDSVAAGEAFILRCKRDALNDGTGDAKLLEIHVTET